MKTDRSSAIRAAAVLLAGLLLRDGFPAAGKTIHLGVGAGGINITFESDSKRMAKALALQVGEVKKRFDENRRTLPAVKGSDGKPAYLRKDVSDLIARTGKDLDEAIAKVQPSTLQPLQDWAADELGRIQGELKGASGKTAEFPAGLFAPEAVAVIAALKPPKKPKKPVKPTPVAPPKPAAPAPDMVPSGQSNTLLDEVGEVVSRIFTLAASDNLTMKLWVGSTPAQSATFSFWPQGKVKGSTPAPTIIRTDGKKGGVLRGLYIYKATWADGAVSHRIEYPQPAGIQVTPSERLDLVKGTGFFCCRFKEGYCYAVTAEKECR